jgi:N-acetyl-anhydromuramyl-L-alanine amidase AmpD
MAFDLFFRRSGHYYFFFRIAFFIFGITYYYVLMKKIFLIACCSIGAHFAVAQHYTADFQLAYSTNPYVLPGVLEAVAWTNSHLVDLKGETESCSGLPVARGVMGLFEDGEGYFRENFRLVAEFSGISIAQQKASVPAQIQAYAMAFNQLMISETSGDVSARNNMYHLRAVLDKLSEIPETSLVNNLARDLKSYEVFAFLNQAEKQQQYGFPACHFHLSALYGATNYRILTAPKIRFTPTTIQNETGEAFQVSQVKSTQYAPAIWNPTPTCNYSSRSGTAISAITIHTIQGTYAGAISWAQNCESSVSYHYVIRSSDGQVTQMVSEQDKAWHVGSENPYTIGYEHEGYIDNASWYTEAMYTASAALSRDIVGSGYGIPALRTFYGAATTGVNVIGGCTKIKGHQHFPNQTHTDPGINWNWEKYYRLINNNPTTTNLTALIGNFYDAGGSAANYTNDERRVWIIQPASVSSLTITFNAFNIESGYDKLFIYDGNSINAPLIGSYTGTTSPGIVSSSGGALTIEFRSDCATVATGWAASWNSILVDVQPPTTVVQAISGWQNANFTVNITDADVGTGVANRYALISDRVSAFSDWHANGNKGYLNESFDTDATGWTEVLGDWTLTGQQYAMADATQANSNASIPLLQDNLSSYLYHWKQTITGTGTNQRAGVHFFCDNTQLANRGNSYFIYLRAGTNTAQIYEVLSDTWTLKAEAAVTIAAQTPYDCKLTYDPVSGWIRLYVDNALIVEWQDPDPLQQGNGFSLRSGGCGVLYDAIAVYRSRPASQLAVTVGSNASVRYISTAAAPSCKVTSIVADYRSNWSASNEKTYLVDWNAAITVNPVAIATESVVESSATAVSTWNPDEIVLYPNPVSEGLTLRGVPEGAHVFLYDANGKQVGAQTVIAPGVYFDTSPLPAGTYQCITRRNDQQVVKSFLKL